MIAQLVVALLIAVRKEPLDDPAVRSMCWELLRSARMGFASDEHAAFIVRSDSGGFICVVWPASDAVDSARWEGAYPRGTVAIVHTHRNWLPMPSRIDINAAAHAHVPVYVITRKHITKTDGTAPQVIVDGDWQPE
jgi:hypothetical protein